MQHDHKDEAVNPKDALGMAKVPLHLVPSAGLIYEALAMTDGARKYGPYNWRDKKITASVYIAACMRHILSWFDGEDVAPDSGVHHLGHARACLGILLDAHATGNITDDRPSMGSAAALLDDFTRKTEDA